MSDFPLPHETVELIVQVLLVVAVVAVFFVVIGILEHRALKSVVGAGAQNVAPTPKPKLKSGPAPTLKLQIDVERKDGDDDVIEETSPLHAGTRESGEVRLNSFIRDPKRRSRRADPRRADPPSAV
mmetsp:Transcript_37919/g.118884  ORF Transcript_37919/g.118884 Transcript_37919/m.118884 type:complete len:126 (-) Transcript_37919:1628-2005(-)